MRDLETFSEETGEDRDIRYVTARLTDEFDRSDQRDAIGPAVQSEFKRFDNAHVRDFVPVFVERRARTNFRTLPEA